MNPIDADFMRETFEYKGGELWWRRRGPNRSLSKSVGCIKGNGYKQVNVNRKIYLLHRVIWAIHHGDPGDMQIDHINQDKLDNRIENLRLATKQENMRNNSARGYSLDKQLNKWCARIVLNGKYIHLGYFVEEAEARQAYLDARQKYFGEFA